MREGDGGKCGSEGVAVASSEVEVEECMGGGGVGVADAQLASLSLSLSSTRPPLTLRQVLEADGGAAVNGFLYLSLHLALTLLRLRVLKGTGD